MLMALSRTYKISTAIGLCLLSYIIACRCSVAVADAYALYVYPVISAMLSAISSLIPWSMQESVVVLLIVLAVLIVVRGCRKKQGIWRILLHELTLVLWIFVWFYMSWCNNYSRSSILARTETPYSQYDEAQFKDFIAEFVDAVNASYTTETMTDKPLLEAETKQFFAHVPERYGLSRPQSWHHPKLMLFNRFYSAVGVQGFMAPLFAESCVNEDLLPDEYPFVYAHEYSHLLGVSNEAEAHWWAYHVGMASKHKSVRYSSYKSILPHVMVNAHRLLTDEEYRIWYEKIRPEVIEDLRRSSQHWQALRSVWLDDMQTSIYDLFLKSNRIESGRKNYSEVVQLIISVKYQ